MAFVPGGKHFGQYTYEHWFDHEYGKDNDIATAELQTDKINDVSDEPVPNRQILEQERS